MSSRLQDIELWEEHDKGREHRYWEGIDWKLIEHWDGTYSVYRNGFFEKSFHKLSSALVYIEDEGGKVVLK